MLKFPWIKPSIQKSNSKIVIGIKRKFHVFDIPTILLFVSLIAVKGITILSSKKDSVLQINSKGWLQCKR